MPIAQIIVAVAATYASVGLVFAIAFVCKGVDTVDHAAKGSHALFRLLILPGAAALWPLLLRRWIAARARGGRA